MQSREPAKRAEAPHTTVYAVVTEASGQAEVSASADLASLLQRSASAAPSDALTNNAAATNQPEVHDAAENTERVTTRPTTSSEIALHVTDALDHAGIGFLHVDVGGRIAACNAPFAGLRGGSVAEMIGTNWLLAIRPEDRQELQNAAQQATEVGQARVEAHGLRNDGSTYVIQVAINRTLDSRNAASGHACIVTDISARRQLEHQFDAVHEWLLEGNAQLEYHLARTSEQTQQLEQRKAELELANARLKSQATTDGLTGLKNHRTFHERLREEVDRATRYRSSLSIVLLDVDDFKSFNDTFGHPAGDMILRTVAEILQANARASDLVARYGGEEFALILTETDTDSARITAERCRAAIETYPWTDRAVTASFGVATLSVSTSDAADLLGRADGALYRSKRRGRNCVTRATDPLYDSEAAADSTETCDTPQQAMNFPDDSLLADTRTLKERLSRSYDSTVESWSRILDFQDKETEGHSKRVTAMTVRLARAVGLSEEQVLYAKWGALLHDIGKMAVPNTILHKPGPLTDEEWEVMRRHPVTAYEMLAPIAFLGPALDIPRYHHEKWDGTGYPDGLKGDEIPLPTRLFAVIDVYDALRTDRPYRRAWPESKVRKHLRERAGTHFDPRAVRTFLKVLDESKNSLNRSA